ncbi:hypothetical protein RQL30_02430 [Citrobacter freundii]|uniref:hypothetical protein n=1 Tax=Citrobacter freundii complex TaxID=1344959 RepID=UPI00080C4E0F|nr:hypothetical protein [Citrobacter freundii]MDT7409797.1 hypothetical protein [Citrobacter freundii]OCF82612.1 hypothetical protein AS299_22285 [Citrobacter freundii]QLY61460.1 hypothetical protein HV211_13675 [Citrobacter freundii]QMF22713.1 hypothetical protein HVY90_13670 [Citrobacter freundii]
MNIDNNKKITTLRFFIEAYPEKISTQAWQHLIDEVGDLKEVYGYIAFLHDDGYLTGSVIFDGSSDSIDGWKVDRNSLRITSQGYSYWKKLNPTTLGTSGMLRKSR